MTRCSPPHLFAVLRHDSCASLQYPLWRWVEKHNPDTDGEQLRAIQKFLLNNWWTEFIWFDFGCLPQKLSDAELTHAEQAYFQNVLSHINLLYLHCNVLILLDADYNRRFWCVYETFLAFKVFDGNALVPGEIGR